MNLYKKTVCRGRGLEIARECMYIEFFILLFLGHKRRSTF